MYWMQAEGDSSHSVPLPRYFPRFISTAAELRATKVKIVAAENFYGNIAEQIGGDRVAVMSILSDPNVDPHEYESNVDDAKAIADADLLIENGGGYDDWMDKLLSASPNAKRILLNGFDLAVTKLPDNEHVWYAGITLRPSLTRLPTSFQDRSR